MHLQKRDYKKKKSFSLIEVLFSIIIMAIIISSIPNLISMVNLSIQTIISKEILYKTLNETMNISVYRWDEHSEDNYSSDSKKMWFNKILDTNSTNFRRVNGTIGRPNLAKNKVPIRQFFTVEYFDNNMTRISASFFDNFKDLEETDLTCFDDLDDWNNITIDYTEDRNIFHLTHFIYYIEDNISGFTDTTSSEIVIKLNLKEADFTSNLKYLKIVSEANTSDEVFSFDYISANIGEEAVVWKKGLVGTAPSRKFFISKKDTPVCE